MLPENFLKTAFFLLYHHFAFTYDLVAWLVSLGQWSAWRRSVIPFLVPGETLELAYGTGGLFLDLVRRGWNPAGIDLSPYMARLTAMRLKRAQLSCLITQSQAQSLPFPSNTFTNVVATFPTNYIFDQTTLAEIHRVLLSTPDQLGSLIVVLQGHLDVSQPMRWFIAWLYHISGQQARPNGAILTPFRSAGFQARWEIVPLPKGKAMLVVAQKQAM